MNQISKFLLTIILAGMAFSCRQPFEKVEYTQLKPTEFRQRMKDVPVAYLPLGTLEWHGEHLPLGADGLQSASFFNDLAREAGGIVLPMLFLGPDAQMQQDEITYYGMDFWFDQSSMKQAPIPSQLDGSAYWVNDSLFCQLLEATLFQLKRAGFKVVVAHGHGPSTNQFLKHRELWEKQFGLKLMACWFEGSNADTGLMCDHAAKNETSLIQYYYPELVKLEQLAKDENTDLRGIAGNDPRKFASPQLGKTIVEGNLKRMKSLIKDALASANETDKSSKYAVP